MAHQKGIRKYDSTHSYSRQQLAVSGWLHVSVPLISKESQLSLDRTLGEQYNQPAASGEYMKL